MASCLITTSGTSGKVLLRYTISSVVHYTETDIGEIYIPDTATAVTYTTLEGDAVSSSLCLTITSLPLIYHKIYWNDLYINTYSTAAIQLNEVQYTIPAVSFRHENGAAILNAVNSVNNDLFKGTHYLYSIGVGENTSSTSLIIRTLGNTVLYLKLNNADNTTSVYLKGEVTAPPFVGYTVVAICETPGPAL